MSSILTIFILMPLLHCGCEGATITNNEPTYYVVERGTALFSWRYILESGETFLRITWKKTSVDPAATILEVDSGGPFIFPAYDGRASTTGTTSNGDASLQLTGVTSADVGQYQCSLQVLNGNAAEATTQLILAVSPAAPVISQSPPSPITTLVPLILTCTTAGGFPAASISWYRGDSDIPVGAPAQQDTLESDGTFRSTRTLTFTPVRGDDGVTYRCVISHVVLSANLQDQLMLNVQSPAEITTAPPSPTRVKQGESTTISCPADGNPATFSYTWKEGARVIDPSAEDRYSESNGVLTINNTPQSLHGTTYTCEVTNNVGNTPASASTDLSVEYGPEVSAPSEETVNEEETLTVQCTVSANPAASVEWKKQGSSTAVSSTAQLSIPNIQQTAAGTYVCTAQNTFHDGSTGTGTANTVVTVQYEPSQPTVTISPNPAVEGQTVTLTCSSASSLPPPHSYSWTRDGQPVSNSGGTLTISSVQHGQAGQYRCSATNVAGTSEESGPVELVVHYEATGTLVTPSTAAEREGDPLTLTCTADGKPDPTFTWSKDPGPIPAGIASSNLVQIPSLHRSHAGTYTCTADNGIGDSDSATSSVDVLYLDTPTLNQTSPLTALEGDSVTILCSAAANPTAGYKWTKLNSSDQWNSNVLTFTQVNRSDAGTYICEASNNIKGTTETDNVTLEIIVNYPPELTVSATPNPVNETHSVSLTCTADSHPDVTSMTWEFVETGETLLQQTTGNSLTYVNSSVSHENAGVYRCTADNGVTGSPVSKDITLHVNFVPIFNHTRDKYAVERFQSTTLECSAFAYPTQIDFTWMKGGYDITGNTTSQSGVSTLNISSVQLENYGDYTCTADNGYGQRSTVIQLVSESKPDPPTNLAYTKKTGAGVVTLTWTAGFNGGLETTHTVQYRMEGTTDWVNGTSVVEDRIQLTLNVTFSEKGRYDIRIRAHNHKGAAESGVIQVLVEGNQILYGILAITNEDYTEGVCEGELSNRIVTQLDSIFDSYKGYEGAEVTGCRSGSVLADFKATVAQSEAAAAQDTYIENLSDGQLGEFTVEPANSKIRDTEDAPGGGGDTTIIIIIAVVCAVVVVAIIGVGVFVVRRRKSANDKKDVELKERKPKPMGIARPYVPVPDSPTTPTPNMDDEDMEGPYATSPSVPMSTGNPYDDVHFEGDGTTAPVAGATAGPLDPNVQYATVNKNNNETPNPSTVYAQVNKKKKDMPPPPEDPSAQYSEVKKDKKKDKKDKEKPTLVVDPSSEYATVDKLKKKKKDVPPPPEDPSAQYSEVKKDKKKDKKASPSPDVIYTEVVKDKKDKKDKKEKKEKEKKPTPAKKPAVAKKPTVKNEERLYDEVPKTEGAAAATTEENPYENPQDSMPEKKKNPQGLIYAELSDFQVKPPPKKPSKPAPPKPRYEDEPTEYASINWNASRRRAQEQSQSGSTTDDETPVTMI